MTRGRWWYSVVSERRKLGVFCVCDSARDRALPVSARRDRELSSRAVVLQLELLSNTEVTSRPRILFKVTSEEKVEC